MVPLKSVPEGSIHFHWEETTYKVINWEWDSNSSMRMWQIAFQAENTHRPFKVPHLQEIQQRTNSLATSNRSQESGQHGSLKMQVLELIHHVWILELPVCFVCLFVFWKTWDKWPVLAYLSCFVCLPLPLWLPSWCVRVYLNENLVRGS